MQFDSRRIVAAAGEDVVKVYDKTDGRHWDCGPGVTLPHHDHDDGGDDDPFTSVTAATDRHSSSHHHHHRQAAQSSNSGAATTRHGSVGSGIGLNASEGSGSASGGAAGAGAGAIIEQVRIKDGYLIEGRKDGIVGMWAC